MNLLFCGDKNIEDGLMIAIASLLRSTDEDLHIFILTMDLSKQERKFYPLSLDVVNFLDSYVKKKDPENFVTLIDMTEMYLKEQPEANLETRFTPYCMLRLFADQLEEIPDRILYLDTDVICRQDLKDFYWQDMEGYEFAGVLDYYGKWFFRQNLFHWDYINSGVLLLNMALIRETGLFKKCRERCQTKEMFMPDQSSLNKLAQGKKIWPRRYNDQRKFHPDTVVQHFSTTFRFFPWIHTVTVKPWEIDRVHQELKLYEYDDLLSEYQTMKEEVGKERP